MTTALSLLGLPGNPTLNDTAYYLKALVHSSAVGATGIEGIVWEVPVAPDTIAGAKIGEFQGGAFEANLDGNSNAVFKIETALFGGTLLSPNDSALVLLRDATKTTGIIDATIIEE